jgi:DNA repair protein RadC
MLGTIIITLFIFKRHAFVIDLLLRHTQTQCRRRGLVRELLQRATSIDCLACSACRAVVAVDSRSTFLVTQTQTVSKTPAQVVQTSMMNSVPPHQLLKSCKEGM